MKAVLILVAASFVFGCATAPGIRMGIQTPVAPPEPVVAFDLPELPLPIRTGPISLRGFTGSPTTWEVPSLPVSLVKTFPWAFDGQSVLTRNPTLLRIPPASRSWSVVAQDRELKPLLPSAPAKVATQAVPPKTSTPKTDQKPAATKPILPLAPSAEPTVSPPTPAASASILPTASTSGSDFAWEDVNSVAGDAVTLHFDRTSWLYLDTPAQQKIVGFQSISREKDSTTFQFRPLVPGLYTLEFQRQDLVNQSVDRRKVRLQVVAQGTRTAASGTTVAPQTSSLPALDSLEASRILAAQGKTDLAIQKLLGTYRSDDARANLELARLLNQGGQDSEALGYLEKNLTLTGPDFQATLELGTKLSILKEPLKRLPAYVKLWSAGTTPPPEELYLQVLTSLRSQKLFPMAKEWSDKYRGWYSLPTLKDQYLFQVGQLLEEPGETRDLRSAWKAYSEVVQSYPLSNFWKAAGERAAYLNRNFLQVR